MWILRINQQIQKYNILKISNSHTEHFVKTLGFSSLFADPFSLPSLGCYRETFPRHFSQASGGVDMANSHPMACRMACSKMLCNYAAMVQGQICFCSNTLPSAALKQADDSNCNTPCTNPVFTGYACGGTGYASVYSAPLPIESMLITSDDTDNIQTTFQPASFSVSVSTHALEYFITLDFDDGGGKDGDRHLTKIYTAPGTYNIRASAGDREGLLPVSTCIYNKTTVTCHQQIVTQIQFDNTYTINIYLSISTPP